MSRDLRGRWDELGYDLTTLGNRKGLTSQEMSTFKQVNRQWSEYLLVP
jgi:hypothetical protein